MPTLADLRAKYTDLNGLDDDQAVDALHQAFYSDMPRDEVANALGVKPKEATPGKSGIIRRGLGDTGLSLLKGAIGVPEAAVGIADTVTGGYAGKLAEDAGFRPKEAKAMLDEYYSPEQKAANKAVQDAHGVVDVATQAIKNPSVVVQNAIESVPSMLGGGVLARGAMRLFPSMSAIVAGGIGEGAVSAGQTAEQVRQETPGGTLTGTQSAIAAGSGALTGVLGMIAGRVANKLGIGDIDTMIAGGVKAGTKGADITQKSFVRNVLEGVVSEGVLEELPQSVQEQVAQNWALGKPLDEGVDQAAVLGMFAGGLMGGGAQAFHHGAPHVEEVGPLSRAANIAIDANAEIARPDAPPVAQQPEPVVMPASMPTMADLAARGIEPGMDALHQAGARDAQALRDFAPEPGAAPAAPAPAAPSEPDTWQPGDLLNKSDAPFTNKGAALRAQKAQDKPDDYDVTQVQGGFVLRPKMAAQPIETVPREAIPDATAPVAGAPIDGEWTSFAPESGTKGIPRADMPQIKAGDRSAMVQFLRARGIDYQPEVEVPASSLKPTQAEFSPDKVAKAREFSDTDRSILVSNDGHVLDGHHQWLAKRDANEPIKAIVLNAPIDELLPAVKEFPSAKQAEGATAPTTTDEPIAEAGAAPQPEAAATPAAPQAVAAPAETRAAEPGPAVAGPAAVEPDGLTEFGERWRRATTDERHDMLAAAGWLGGPRQERLARTPWADIKPTQQARIAAGKPAPEAAAQTPDAAKPGGEDLTRTTSDAAAPQPAEAPAKKPGSESVAPAPEASAPSPEVEAARKRLPGAAKDSDEVVLAMDAERAAEDRVKAETNHSPDRVNEIRDELVNEKGGESGVRADRLGFHQELAKRFNAEADRLKADREKPGTLANRRQQAEDEKQRTETNDRMHRANLEEIDLAARELGDLERQGRVTPDDVAAVDDIANTSKDSFETASRLHDIVDGKKTEGRETTVEPAPAANDAKPPRPEEVIELRKRVSVLESLRKCLAA